MLDISAYREYKQVPLIHIVNEDDELLYNSPEADWYRTLKEFPWRSYRQVAVEYYDALYHFNRVRMLRSYEKVRDTESEEKGHATQRLLFSRATMDKSVSILNEDEFTESTMRTIAPSSIAPGITPDRLGGKKPKCFFALFKSFIGVSLMGFAPEPEHVHKLLSSNLSFARVCGFIPKDEDDRYWYKHVPSLRKLEQFDQVMTEYGLWDKAKWDEVSRNIDEGIIERENELVGDTTHFHAESQFETVKYVDEDGNEKKKSQSKTSKNCRCENKDECHHKWELVDEGAGTVVKSPTKVFWAHKASVIGLARQGIPLDAVAVADAATYDGETLYPHVIRLFDNLPTVKEWIDRVLYDRACDNQPLKDKFADELGIELKTSVNPRRRKAVTENLPRGMKELSPYGNLICNAGITMEYQGVRFDSDKFIFKAPVDKNNTCVCSSCEYKAQCCPNSNNGRVVTVSFDLLPHINPDDPPMSKRFKAIMMRRPSVERMIKRLKCDLSDDQLTKRGNASFQAYLDKTMIAFHILLRG